MEISDSAGWRTLGAAKQRALLAVLIAAGGRPVSMDRLVEELWSGQAPASAVNLVQVYVARTRRALRDPEGRMLHTQAPGYQLVLAETDVDAWHFESLTGQGMTALRDGALDAAAGLLADALALWRGQPFCDVPGPAAVEAEANRLDQLRLTALEARIEADLGLGRHLSLVPELETLVRAHPMRERFWGQLMLALYRCGRQADALEAYQQLYGLLDEQLGLEPSRALRDLQHQILSHDRVLRVVPVKPTKSTETAGLAVPRQLPAGIGHFVAREEHLKLLDAMLSCGEMSQAVVIGAISGTAGIGKTTLAVHWAHRVADQFPDGQLYVNLRGFDPSGRGMRPAEVIRGFLDALGVRSERIPTALEAQVGLYRSLLAGKRLLVVLDNARDAAQVRPLLPGAPGCLVLVTSRDQLSGLVAAEGAHALILSLLAADEARQLLSRRIGDDRMAAEPTAVTQIVDRCARLPLALAIAAARAATNPELPLTTLAAELRQTRVRLDAFAGNDLATDVRAVFSWSYSTLSPDAARLFRLLGVHCGPDISAPAAASLAGVPLPHVRQPLTELCRAHLLTEHVPGRYSFHDLLHAYARERAELDEAVPERHAALHRLLDHYLHTAYSANRLLYPQGEPITLASPQTGVSPELSADYEQALGWFTAEHPVLLAILTYAADAGFDTHTWQLAWALHVFLFRRGHWHDQAAAWQVALDATRRLGDHLEQARAHRNLGYSYTRVGRFDDARTHLHHALDLDRGCGDRVGQAHTHRTLALACAWQECHADALDHAERALELYREVGHRYGQADALNAVGLHHAELGRHRQALTCCEQALELFQELGYRDGEAVTWNSLGYAHHNLRQFQHAASCYQHALDLCRKFGDRYQEADTLSRLGDTQYAIGDAGAARETWQQALTLLEELDHPDADKIRAKLHHATS